jgi:NTP pyrophosphatase (non-canonical NTP hydrolase)
MIELKALQKEVLANKIRHGFNTTDLHLEFTLAYEEMAEAVRAHRKNLPDFGEELADVIIYLLGIAEISGIDLETEILRKIEKNRHRRYQRINGDLQKIDD